MNSVFDVLQKPVVTERAANLKASNNQYVFRVSPDATKLTIKAAIEQLFKVHVEGVNTMLVRGKFRRMGANRGSYRSTWKKAIVTLKPGEEIKTVEESK